MANPPNKLSRFLKEIKRRNVHRLMAVYGGTAFIIFEASTIIFPRWGLPDWTIDLVLYLLILGAIITFALGWIYDINPEGGIVKTEPIEKVKAEEVPKSSNRWKIASYISFVVIVGLIILNVFPRDRSANSFNGIETSIAVLPFENMSINEEDGHLGNAFTDEIIMTLQSIKAFDRVLSYSSTMQFAQNRPSVPDIAEKLNVNYLVEGSIQKYQNRIRVRVQFIRAFNEDHIWGDSFDHEYIEPKDILTIQTIIAQEVAGQLKVSIAPEEKLMIETVPTSNLNALTLYQKGRNAFQNYFSTNDKEQIAKAEGFYHKALNYDREFAKAYVGLAQVYWTKHYGESFFSENFLDSVLILSNKALTFNENLSEAYFIRGSYYYEKGDLATAEKEFDQAIELNPNNWESYYYKATLYGHNDLINLLDNCLKASSLCTGSQLPRILRGIVAAYQNAGFPEQALDYTTRIFELDQDSAKYYMLLAGFASARQDFENQHRYILKAYAIDTNTVVRGIGHIVEKVADSYANLGQYDLAVSWYEKYMQTDYIKGYPNLWGSHRIGYAYWQTGNREKADYFFNQQLEYSTNEINLGRARSEQYFTYYDLAAVYAFMGEMDKALDNLKIFNEKKTIHHWMVLLIKTDPLFDSIRDASEFQQIVRDVEAKYQTEHERVRQWLDENDML
jgi:TolB-like protein